MGLFLEAGLSQFVDLDLVCKSGETVVVAKGGLLNLDSSSLNQLDGLNGVWNSVESEDEANLSSFFMGFWLWVDKILELKWVNREGNSGG